MEVCANMDNRQIIFTGVNTAQLLETENRKTGSNGVVVRTAYSTISAGTEKANITGCPHVSIFSEENEPVVFPRQCGYSSSGVVIGKGEQVTSVEIGDRVVMSWSNHERINVLPEDNVVKIPYDSVSMQAAAICHIGTFPMAALRKTALEIGESMLVMGLGVLGLLAVQFARAAGAVPVIAVDPNPARREKALELGADYALDPFGADFAAQVKALSFGGVHTAIEVTGLGAGLNQCLDCMRPFGRIALLGCTRDKNFTVDYYRKVHGPGITLVGAHTNARPKFESAPHYFTQRDDIETMLRLCAMGRIKLEELVDEVHAPQDCQQVYDRLVREKDFPPVVQFDWSRL